MTSTKLYHLDKGLREALGSSFWQIVLVLRDSRKSLQGLQVLGTDRSLALLRTESSHVRPAKCHLCLGTSSLVHHQPPARKSRGWN